MNDFTLDVYQTLLLELVKENPAFIPFGNVPDATQAMVVLRHDVDTMPGNSLKTAEIEAKLGIKGTYFFRIVSQSNNPDIINEIASMGHEIGYHYEDLALCKGKMDEAIKSFEKNLNYFRQFYPVNTICMHGSPMSKFDNRKIWEKYNYRDFGIISEPYFDVDYSKVLYLTDTGRRWDGEKVSVRDKVGIRDKGQGTSKELVSGKQLTVNGGVGVDMGNSNLQPTTDNPQPLTHNFHSTFDIIKAAKEGRLPDQIMITVHPQRWTDNPVLWMKELVMQNVKNQVKRFIVNLK